MSDDDINETLQDADPPVEGEQEAQVEAEAEAMAAEDGFPAELADGTVVRIVDKDGPYSIDGDGNRYTADAVHGHLNPAA